MKSQQNPVKKYLGLAIFFLLVIGVLIAFSNLSHLKQHFASLNPVYLLLSILSALCVYIIEGLILKEALYLFNEKIKTFLSIKYSLIINSIGYLVSLGGLTPFATQVYILDYHNINAKKSTLTRILQIMLFNIVFNIMLIVGFIFLVINKASYNYSNSIILIPFAALIVIVSLFYFTLFWKKFRVVFTRISTNIINKIIRIFTKKVKISPLTILDYLGEFDEGLKQLISKPSNFILMVLTILVDWAFWMGTLYFAFLAVNYKINIEFLVVGFAVGQIIGLISMVPGGAGTLEASMSLAFKAFGIPFETSIAAVLIYRCTFYIFPFLLSMPLYFSLKKKLEPATRKK